MNNKKGGYIIVDLLSANLLVELTKAYASGKPILVYDADGKANFYTLSYDDVSETFILTGAKNSFAIASDGTVTSYDGVLMENIKDLSGNLRFIEGDITTNEIEDVTFNYAKWSLSGTHLMFVVAGEIANGTVLPFSVIASNIDIPQWIKDKIIPLFATDIVSRLTLTLFADDATTQTVGTTLYKRNTGNVDISISAITLTASRKFRIQFDLLIDAE